MADTKQMRGRDVDAPVFRLKYDGEMHTLKFNNKAYRIAEDVYEDCYGRNRGIYQIMQECAIPKQRALMAVYYGALVAGGMDKLAFDDFEENFSISDIDGVAEAVQRGIMDSLPEEDPKNA